MNRPKVFYTFADPGQDEVGGFECVAQFDTVEELKQFLAECAEDNLEAGEEPDEPCKLFRITIEEIPQIPSAENVPASPRGTE